VKASITVTLIVRTRDPEALVSALESILDDGTLQDAVNDYDGAGHVLSATCSDAEEA
jgi:hypothetical protein